MQLVDIELPHMYMHAQIENLFYYTQELVDHHSLNQIHIPIKKFWLLVQYIQCMYIYTGAYERCEGAYERCKACLLYTSPSPRDATLSRMPSSA